MTTRNWILLIAMVFFHVFDDFHLQGILASMKQKEWWQEQTNQKKYRFDYIPALLAHAFSWTVMIHIPVAIYTVLYHPSIERNGAWMILFFFTLAIHALVDNLKANEHKINLIVDQAIHLFQILLVFLFYAEVG